MKNKKWKRKAKRLIGECIKNNSDYGCCSCECLDECLGIREVEKRFKEGLDFTQMV